MRITLLSENKAIPFSDLINSTLRFDLVPIPLSVEFTVKSNQEYDALIKEGTQILIGDIETPLTIIKTQPLKTQTVKDGIRIGAIACVAIITGTENLIKALDKAVILSESSFNSAVRACGCKISLGSNIPLAKFVCLKGVIPTFRVAVYLQQEGCVIGFINSKMTVVKIDSLLKQEAKLTLDPSAIAWFDSLAIENMRKNSYVSVSSDGSTIYGADNTVSGIGVIQKGGLSARELKNLEKVLVTRGTVIRPLDLTLMAGDVVKINDKAYVILTAAHYFDTGALNGESITATKLWIASL